MSVSWYNICMKVLERIEILRKNKGWSVYKLAEESNITQSTLSNMFARGTQPSIDTLTALCKGLGISLSEFFAENEKEFAMVHEQQLITNYRKLNTNKKEAILQLVKKLSEDEE